MDDPFAGRGGLLEVGLGSDGYAAIGRAEADLVARTGRLDLASALAGRQTVARFFIAGFGTPVQRANWLGATAAVAISEPGVGAHPKHLSARAEPAGDGWRLTGEKAWASNGPFAAVFIVLAIMGVEDGRKRYGAFLVPRGTPGLTLHETATRHCGLSLENCEVPGAAVLGAPGAAYETMALPFRDVEDAVGLSGLAGAFRFLVPRLGGEAHALGGLIALAAVLEAGARRIAAALDGGVLADNAAEAIGLRLLAAEIGARVRCHRAEFGLTDDAEVDRLLAELEAGQSVARGPRAARQARLASGRTA
ncbi:MAG: acyl-CoA dehydrogenase family protein [Acetobacteraceae bacterium]